MHDKKVECGCCPLYNNRQFTQVDVILFGYKCIRALQFLSANFAVDLPFSSFVEKYLVLNAFCPLVLKLLQCM